MSDKIILKYTLPILGNIEIPLYEEASVIYTFLERQDQIDRLKNLNQLGIVSDVIQTAHHSKFEYLLFMLFLIESMKKLKGVYPLGRKVVGQLTGKELLKIWAMLLSVGHMPGTFPVEKAILKFLRQEIVQRREFFQYITPRPTRDYVNKLLEKQNIYSFYHALSFFALRRRSQSSESKRSQELLTSYCYAYDKPCIVTLRDLFGKIRSFAHLVLDSYYTGSPNIFATAHITKIPALITASHFDRLIESLKSYLIHEIYRCPQSVIAEVALYNAFHIRLRHVKKPVDFIYHFMSDVRGDAEIYQIFSDYCEKKKINKMEFYDPLQVTTNRGNIFSQEREIYIILYKFLKNKNKFNVLLFNIDKPPGADNSIISIFINKKHSFKRVGLLPNLLRELLTEIRKNESPKYSPLFRIIKKRGRVTPEILTHIKSEANETNICNFFETIFRTLFNERVVHIRMISKKIDFMPDGFIDTAPYLINELFEAFKIENHELLELKKLINNRVIRKASKPRPKLFILTNNVELNRPTQTKKGFVIGEFDGAVLTIEGTKLFLYLLEAKKKTRPHSEGRRQLLGVKRLLKDTYKRRGLTKVQRIELHEKSHYLRIKIS